ncbi:threonine/serine dehydratase [Mesorhizobium sp. RP14(2022)]|uniref:Threonine/serine dehydratase n=1 Tax=Mesorhizobium liriopis TaxID=2953882 RepID=A0ABT1C9S5_9HYPH|nr:threonine/serine dehydratase [Mesorhizobium liriopis]MCO6051532.1 threonine/serine dehydratase [Mesorhizobium liriopis]
MTHDAILAAAERIAPFVRRTPVLKLEHCAGFPIQNDFFLKLECLQVSGSFKVRGALNRLKTLDANVTRHGLVAASGGNHGLATAYVAKQAGLSATVFLPTNASPLKEQKLRQWGADVRYAGAVWDEAHEAAQIFAAERGAFYMHPFADSAIVAGQGTVAVELLEQVPDADLYIVAIGGGGLITGMSAAIKAVNPDVRIIGVEPTGSPTLHASFAAGHVVRLPQVTTRVATMACGRTDESIYEAARRTVDEIVLIEDEHMIQAAQLLWFEFGIAADLSGAASLAALMAGAVKPEPGQRIVGLVCGAGVDGVSN